jgi:diaminohydroxyphosphoribosylaminopyrimidine deaminase/5-amino-6-(5-phosphoribosylamino)uracil reductase
MITEADAVYMARAIKLARRGLYTTDPNPRVGCVLVKHGAIIAEGWHVRAGQDHAEIHALKQAENAQGATAYVTLEPCSHHGKTPPCCAALIADGVKRVVVAMQDPNPLVAGKGVQRLQSAGIQVDSGLLEVAAKELNRGFVSRMNKGRPFVFSKLAMSVDGRTAMASGESKWITSKQARQDVHRLRAESSAILTGINTVLADDSSMTARLDQAIDVEQPIRVILDSKLRMPVTANMAKLSGRSIILTCSTDKHKTQALLAAGFEVLVVAEQHSRVDLHAAMQVLSELQINQLMVEAGAELNGAMISLNMVDEWLIYMAPVLLGDEGRGLFHLPDLKKMTDKMNLTINEARMIGPDLRLRLTAVQ